ncbi:MarR family transcriptional regulator [uncultured Aquabacterium sp.]|uniref:MarR family transcriptional regulator n=1 Tax=uncultured Aquabacterium sp. TaxID=158753 RepID=UPI0025E03DA1|nr:MarR family transcriptional regulator [uncultured Aquabacterium sp.]
MSNVVINSLGYATGLALHYFSDHPMTVGELSQKMGISHSGASKHRRLLSERGLIHVVDRRKPDGLGAPSNVYAAKAKHPKPSDDRCGFNGIDKTRFAEMKYLLTGHPMTVAEIADELGLEQTAVRTRLRYWMKGESKHFRISRWALQESGRQVYVPYYVYGSGPDAKKPPKLGSKAATQRYREKKRVIVNSIQLAARHRGDAAVVISPFSQLLMATGARGKVVLEEAEAA